MTDADLTPTKAVAANAEKGLRLRKEFKRGGTEVGVARARQLAERKPVSPDVVKRMSSYFARHNVDKRAANFGDDGNPSAGYVAWLLWGGEAGKDWADRKKAELGGKPAGKKARKAA
jgi:hypothetical protein